MKCYEIRADFVYKESRDSARLALHNQPVYWDGGTVGHVEASYKTDDTSLFLKFFIEENSNDK